MSPQLRAFCQRQFTGGRLLFWIIWYTTHLGLFAYGWHLQARNKRLALLNTLRYSVWISRGAGLVLAFDGSLILLPVLRNILCYIRPKLRKLPLDQNIFFHKQVAYSMVFWAMVHTTAHYVNFYNVEATKARPVKAWQIHYTEVGGITGHIMLLCMALMYTTAQIKIRRQCFEAFWYIHHLAFVFMLALYSHASGCFVRDTPLPFSPFTQVSQFWDHCIGYQSFRGEVLIGILYIGERAWREIRARRATTIKKIVMHPRGVIEIQFNKPSMKYKAGQYLFMNVPELSAWQYHPFTITSCPQDSYISVHIRQVGDWTFALGRRLGIHQDYKGYWSETSESVDHTQKALEHCQTLPQIRIDGPYGCPAEDIEENQIAIICGAGIGITPWASVLKNIYHRRNETSSKSKLIRLELIWICRDSLEFEWFQQLLAELERPVSTKGRIYLNSPARPDFLKLHIFLTAKLGLDDIKNYIINDSNTDDAFTRLACKTKFGRPNFDELLGNVKGQIEAGTYIPEMQQERKTNVGFYFCGPSALGKSISLACKNNSSKGVRFDFHKETF